MTELVRADGFVLVALGGIDDEFGLSQDVTADEQGIDEAAAVGEVDFAVHHSTGDAHIQMHDRAFDETGDAFAFDLHPADQIAGQGFGFAVIKNFEGDLFWITFFLAGGDLDDAGVDGGEQRAGVDAGFHHHLGLFDMHTLGPTDDLLLGFFVVRKPIEKSGMGGG